MKIAMTTLLALVLMLGTMPAIVMAETIDIGGQGSFTVGYGVTAIVAQDITGNIDVDGGVLYLNANHTVIGTVTVQNGGVFSMSAGTITGAGTRGVTVTGSGSTFTMSGGIITGNDEFRGGGVSVDSGASFTMSGNALISNNIANSTAMRGGGGGVLVDGPGSEFIMTSGKITGNVGHNGGGVMVSGGAMFTMDGSEARIYRNEALGRHADNGGGGVMVLSSGSEFHMNAGSVARNFAANGAGVRILDGAKFYMAGGIVEWNIADGLQGGGVHIGASTFTMSGNSIIRYNQSPSSGGVRLVGSVGVMHMHDGTIYNNTANGQGGGIGIASSARLYMHNGTIRGNVASTVGGGVAVASATSVFTANNGVISGNTAGTFGGGIWAINYNTLTTSNTVQFSGNIANALHNHGIENRGSSAPIAPQYGGGSNAQGGNPQNIDWDTVSMPSTHALNNFDINYTGASFIPPIDLPTESTDSPTDPIDPPTEPSTDPPTSPTNSPTVPPPDLSTDTPDLPTEPTIPPPTTSPQPEMIKNPCSTVVRVGDIINWTLRGFHNRSGNEVANFAIIDIPSRGLNFVSGTLPAFTNGEDITFDIRYTVYGSNEWRTFSSGIDASRPFEFTFPQPSDLWYTAIEFYFGIVPEDFALGDEIVLTFIVGADAPNNQLVNRFIVRYSDINREGLSLIRPEVLPADKPQLPDEPASLLLVLPDDTILDEPLGQSRDGGEEAPNAQDDTHYPALDAEHLPSDAQDQNDGADENDILHSARTNPQTGDLIAIATPLGIASLAVAFGAMLLIGKQISKKDK